MTYISIRILQVVTKTFYDTTRHLLLYYAPSVPLISVQFFALLGRDFKASIKNISITCF